MMQKSHKKITKSQEFFDGFYSTKYAIISAKGGASMHEKEKISFLANGTKLLIECLPLDRKEKIYAQSAVDLVAGICKLAHAAEEAKLEHIRKAAFFCGLERVVAFPYEVKGQELCLLKMYGGDIAAFCRSADITLLADPYIPESALEIEAAANKHGIVLYQRQ